MSDERFENTNTSRGMSDTDKGYYEDPLMGKNEGDAEATAYRGRRPQRREDVEEVREARMQQVSYEINEVSRAPQQEGDPTRYVSRRARHSGIVSEELPEAAPRAATMNDDENKEYKVYLDGKEISFYERFKGTLDITLSVNDKNIHNLVIK